MSERQAKIFLRMCNPIEKVGGKKKTNYFEMCTDFQTENHHLNTKSEN